MSLSELADEVEITDARLLWHLRQMRRHQLVTSDDEALWARTSLGLRALQSAQPRVAGRAFPARIVDDFEDAFIETDDGLYGTDFIQGTGEHRTRLSSEQAAEFSEKLMRLVEEYFAPGRGERTGIKYGFHWVLTPIDLHPIEDD